MDEFGLRSMAEKEIIERKDRQRFLVMVWDISISERSVQLTSMMAADNFGTFFDGFLFSCY